MNEFNTLNKEIKELKKDIKALIKLVERIVEQEKKWQDHENALVWEEINDDR